MSITFTVEQVEVGPDGLSVLMHGKAAGYISPGMILNIPLNSTFSVGCKIERVMIQRERATLIVATDEEEEAALIAALNPVGESLEVVSQ